jgi:hypothetical protein
MDGYFNKTKEELPDASSSTIVPVSSAMVNFYLYHQLQT